MTDTTDPRHHADRRSTSSGRAPSPRSIRRALSAVRRGWDDSNYLSQRLFERP
jgi:hypothetical protein